MLAEIGKTVRRFIDRRAIRDRDFVFLFDRDETGEVVSLDCETTGLDPWVDDICAIAAVKVRGRTILASERFEVLVRPPEKMGAKSIKVHRLREMDVANARPMAEVLPDLLHFIGSRPLLGYYIDFDVNMINKYLLEYLNIHLPNRRIEVSEMYYKLKYKDAGPGTTLDLTFARILKDLNLPDLPAHDAFNDALSVAMMYVQLTDFAERGVALAVERPSQELRRLHAEAMG